MWTPHGPCGVSNGAQRTAVAAAAAHLLAPGLAVWSNATLSTQPPLAKVRQAHRPSAQSAPSASDHLRVSGVRTGCLWGRGGALARNCSRPSASWLVPAASKAALFCAPVFYDA
eukprot:365946-Chlamydomonas_euryale.AAC.13